MQSVRKAKRSSTPARVNRRRRYWAEEVVRAEALGCELDFDQRAYWRNHWKA